MIRRRDSEVRSRLMFRELSSPITRGLLMLTGCIAAAIGTEITRRELLAGRFGKPVLGLFVTTGIALLMGAGTLKTVCKVVRRRRLPSPQDRDVAVRVNVVTAFVALIFWCIYFVMTLPNIFKRFVGGGP